MHLLCKSFTFFAAKPLASFSDRSVRILIDGASFAVENRQSMLLLGISEEGCRQAPSILCQQFGKAN